MHNFQTNSPIPYLEITYGGFANEEDAKEMERLLKESFKQYDVVVKRHETLEDPTGYTI